MAKEKFIIGKRDNGAHDGKYSNTKRDQEAAEQLRNVPLPKEQTWIIRRKMPRMPRDGK